MGIEHSIPQIKENKTMIHEEIINNIKTFIPREDNLEYEHKDLDKEVQRNKIAMHIESEVKSGHLMNYLKQDASVMKVDISALQDNADLYNEIFADPEDRGLMLYLASHEFIRDNITIRYSIHNMTDFF